MDSFMDGQFSCCNASIPKLTSDVFRIVEGSECVFSLDYAIA